MVIASATTWLVMQVLCLPGVPSPLGRCPFFNQPNTGASRLPNSPPLPQRIERRATEAQETLCSSKAELAVENSQEARDWRDELRIELIYPVADLGCFPGMGVANPSCEVPKCVGRGMLSAGRKLPGTVQH
jgi:hypothetical protein